MKNKIDEIGQLKKQGKKQKAFLKALSENLGNITKTCEEIGISRNTFYEWKKYYENFAADAAAIDDEILDWVEENAFNRIKEKSDTMIIFFLKTKGKKRGYIEKTEQAGTIEISIHDKFVENLVKNYGTGDAESDRD